MSDVLPINCSPCLPDMCRSVCFSPSSLRLIRRTTGDRRRDTGREQLRTEVGDALLYGYPCSHRWGCRRAQTYPFCRQDRIAKRSPGRPFMSFRPNHWCHPIFFLLDPSVAPLCLHFGTLWDVDAKDCNGFRDRASSWDVSFILSSGAGAGILTSTFGIVLRDYYSNTSSCPSRVLRTRRYSALLLAV